jgi:hypothetical protein
MLTGKSLTYIISGVQARLCEILILPENALQVHALATSKPTACQCIAERHWGVNNGCGVPVLTFFKPQFLWNRSNRGEMAPPAVLPLSAEVLVHIGIAVRHKSAGPLQG